MVKTRTPKTPKNPPENTENKRVTRSAKRKSARPLFEPSNVIGPNDILVDTSTGKIKLGDDSEIRPVLKEDREESRPELICSSDPNEIIILDSEGNEASKIYPIPQSAEQEIRYVKEEVDIPTECHNENLGLLDGSDHSQPEVNVPCLERALQHRKRKIQLLNSEMRKKDLEVLALREELKNRTPQRPGKNSRTEENLEGEGIGQDIIPIPIQVVQVFSTRMLSDSMGQSETNEETDGRILTLFPEVLKAYFVNFAKSTKVRESILNLSCRLVCKAWRDGMDVLLAMKESVIGACAKVELRIGDIEDVQETVTRIFKEYGESNGSILPISQPKELIISYQDGQPSVDSVSRSRIVVQRFLEQFGNGIGTFKHFAPAQLSLHYTSFIDWYITFRTWITLMPNLRTLELIKHADNNADEESSWMNIYGSQVTSDMCLVYPFPKSQQLMSLRMDGISKLNSVMASVLALNNQIENIHYEDLLVDYCSFPNATSVKCGITDSINVASFLGLKSRVEKLEINNFLVMDSTNRKLILDELNTFDKLDYLSIKISSPFFDFQPILLPKLKILELENQSPDTPLWNDKVIFKMVCRLKSLELLILRKVDLESLGWCKESQKMSYSQLKKCLRTRLVSKLWELLPNLKTIKVRLHLTCSVSSVEFLFIRETFAVEY